jgi:P4 family phage/plasmid primase-like protien
MTSFADALRADVVLPAPPGDAPQPQDTMSQRFAATVGAGRASGSRVVWPLDAPHPYVFHEGRWTASRPLLEQLYRAYREATDASKHWRTNGSIRAVMDRVRSEPGEAVPANVFDTDPYLFGTPTGVLDLRTGKTLPAEPGHMVSMFSRASYDPDYKAGDLGKQWLAGLRWSLDPATVRWLQVYLGAAMLGYPSIKGFLYLQGVGNAGKTTLSAVVKATLGDYAAKAKSDVVANTLGRHHDAFAMKQVLGKRLVLVDELTGRQELDEGFIKAFTGEADAVVRVMRQDAFEIPLTGSLLLQGNEDAARAAVNDSALVSRMRIVPFMRKREGDRDAGMALLHAMTTSDDVHMTVMKWLMKGCLEFQRNGEAPQSEVMLAAKQRYIDENDPIGVWLRSTGALDNLPGVGHWPFFSEVRRSYSDWRCDNEGVEDPRDLRPQISPKQLASALKAAEVEFGTTGGRPRYRLNLPHTANPKPEL